MARSDTIRIKVREFQVRNNFGRSDADNFAPWWIHMRFKVSEEDATNSSSDGSNDFGIDGFHITRNGNSTALALVQAKYTSDIQQIRKGIFDLARFMPTLNDIIARRESNAWAENRILRVLRARLLETEISGSSPLDITGYVLSLSDDDKELIEAKLDNAKDEIRKAFDRQFRNPHLSFALKVLTTQDLVPYEDVVIRPATPTTIFFDGSEELPMGESVLYAGIGHLGDIVDLYETRGNQLFDKNVRLYIYGKKNEIRGPAGKIKETLEKIAAAKWSPQKFAFLHNGITVYTSHVDRDRESRSIQLTKPSVLNGCQTIKAANFFLQDHKKKHREEPPHWREIPISIRVVRTDDEALWREVSESNNRQNAMKPSALRANDPIQIILENRFRDMKIFYERQEQAFENISRSDFDQIEEEFSNSVKEPITIESLAQAVVCASTLSLAYASKQSDIFEQANIYQRVFADKHLSNLNFLVFAHNVRKVIDLAVERAIPENTRKFDGFRPKRYRDVLTRLALQATTQHWDREIHQLYGSEVVSRRGKLAGDLADFLRGVLKSMTCPILKVVGDFYWNDKNREWVSQTDAELLKLCTKQLHLQNVDVFTAVQGYSYEVA